MFAVADLYDSYILANYKNKADSMCCRLTWDVRAVMLEPLP